MYLPKKHPCEGEVWTGQKKNQSKILQLLLKCLSTIVILPRPTRKCVIINFKMCLAAKRTLSVIWVCVEVVLKLMLDINNT